MSEIKWIKLTTSMFEDEKVDFIESLPETDSILIIWIKLLTLAGKCNMKGHIFLTENIPYTDEMLAHKFRRPLSTVRLALETFKRLGMIEVDENSVIQICNWEKHQNIDGMERIREQNRIRKQKEREKTKFLLEDSDMSRDMSRDVTENVTRSHATDIDKDIDKEINNMPFSSSPLPYKEIIDYLNEKTGSKFRASSEETKRLIKARFNAGFTLEDFKKVIDVKSSQWLNNKDMNKYLRPKTLFGTNFEGYLNEYERDNKPTPSSEPSRNYQAEIEAALQEDAKKWGIER